MFRSITFGFWIALLLGVWAPLAAQPASKTLEFSLDPAEERPILFGAILRKRKRWKVYSVGLTLHSTDVGAQSCQMTLTGQGRAKKKRKDLSKGELGRYDLVPDHPDISIEIFEVSEHFCQGRLTVTSEKAQDWRGLSVGTADYVLTKGEDHLTPKPKDKGIKFPRLVHQTRPDYTRAAEDVRVQGTIMLQFVIDEAGKVDPESVFVLDMLGYGLEEKAIEEVLNFWQFLPGSKDGSKAPFKVIIEITFTLR